MRRNWVLRGVLMGMAVVAAGRIGWGTNYTWTGAANATWSTAAANWTAGSGNVSWPSAGTDTAVFNSVPATGQSILISGSVSAAGVTFLTSGWTVNGGLSVGAGVSGDFVISNAGTNRITGGISASTNGLTVNGTGTLTIGAGSYPGGTTIGTGVTLKTTGTLPSTTSLTASGTLDLNGVSQTVNSLSGSGTVTDSGAAAVLAVNTYFGLAYSGTLSGSNLGLTVQGSGNVELNTVCTLGGPVSVLPANSGTSFVRAGYLQMNNGAGVANTTVNVGAMGRLLISASASSPAARMGGMALANGAVVTFSGSGTTTGTFGVLTIGGTTSGNAGYGAGEQSFQTSQSGGGTSTLNFSSLSRVAGYSGSGYGTVVFSGMSGGTKLLFGTAPSLITSGVGTGILPYALVDATAGGPGQSFATYDATAGIRALSVGEYQVNPGVMAGNYGNVLLNASGSSVPNSASSTSLTLQNGGVGTALGGAGMLRTGAILSLGAGENVIDGPAIYLNTEESDIFVVGNLTIRSYLVISTAAGPRSLTVSGPGVLTLDPTVTNGFTNTNIRINSGTLKVTSTAAWAGVTGVVLSGGTLEVSGTATLGGSISIGTGDQINGLASGYMVQVDGGGSLTVTSIVNAPGTTNGFTKTGAGKLTITGAATANTLGSSTVSGGSVSLMGAGTILSAGTLNMMPGTLLNIDSSGNSSTAVTRTAGLVLTLAAVTLTSGNGTNDQMGLLTLNSGASTFAVATSSAANATGTVTVGNANGALSRKSGSTIVFSGTNLGAAAGTGAVQVKIGNTSGLVNGIWPYALADTTAGGNGLGFAGYDATNGVVLAALSTGTIATAVGANLQVTTSDHTAGFVNSLTIHGNGLSVGSGTVTVASGGIFNAGGANSIDAATLASGTEVIVHAISDLTITSKITGATGFTKAGPGKVMLTNTTSTYSGTTTINGGIMAISSGANLGASSGVTINPGGSLELTASGPLAKMVTLNPGGTTGIIVDPGAVVSIGSAGGSDLFGTGTLTKSGGGTLVLAGSGNTYSGGTVLSQGTLLVMNYLAIPYGDLTVNGGILGGSGPILGKVVAGSGAHVIAPSATLSGTSATTLTISSGLTTGAGTTLAFNLLTPNVVSGGSDLIYVTGSGGLVLNGGTVQVNAGTGAGSLGYYKVMQYSGAIGGAGLGSLSLPTETGGVTYTWDVTHDPGYVDLHRGFVGDANDDGVVDLTDLTTLAGNWQQAGTWSQGDFNGDGVVDLTDLTMLAGEWQGSVGSFGTAEQMVGLGGMTAVPEAGTIGVLGVGMVGLLRRRRRVVGRDLVSG